MLVVACALLSLSFAQDLETVRELHANGAVAAEFEAVRAADGTLQRHGSYKAFHADGSPAASGHYDAGLRQGEWQYWNESGQLDPVQSGVYTLLVDVHADGRPRARGESRNGLRHGQWVFWWENGAVRATGSYREGRHHGEWRFSHPDGTLDPVWISGQWADGARVGPLALTETEPPGPLDTQGFPQLHLDARLNDTQRAEARRLLEVVIGTDAAARDAAAATLVGSGTSIVPAALEALCALDFASETDNRRARMIHERILTPCAGGLSMAWRVGTATEDVAANRMSALRWGSLWLQLEGDPELRVLEWPSLVRTAIRESRPLETVHFAPSDGSPAPLGLRGSGSGPFAPRFLPQGEKDALLGDGVRVALDDGLRWLAAHQAADGRWSAAGFSARCGQIGPGTCSGPGEKQHDVGITALALLAFLADGNTTRSGPWRDTVANGVAWLISVQDVKGRLGEQSQTLVYDHGIATLALCEALCTSDSTRLRWATKRALDVVILGQNPYAGWRYALPPNGENDTSVTAWMMQAVWAGKQAGERMRGDPGVGGLNWIEQVTDPATGRVGYDASGTPSSRIPGKNDRFPREKGEALTAAGLFCRHLFGQRPKETQVMQRHAELLLHCLPEWEPEALGIDLYYWYFGSQALWQTGDPSWSTWRAALVPALLAGQARDGDARGSWDAISVWSFASGRVGTTALALLALEAPIRLARLE